MKERRKEGDTQREKRRKRKKRKGEERNIYT
jgi:hypothetical protein